MEDIIINFKAWCYRQRGINLDIDFSEPDEVVNNYMWENNLFGQEIYDALIKALNEING